jgi:hypothetical protein
MLNLKSFPQPDKKRPRVEPFGPEGGVTVTYPDCDSRTLAALRQYQSVVKKQSPQWMSRLDFDAVNRVCTLHVFPVRALPYAFFQRPQRYGV